MKVVMIGGGGASIVCGNTLRVLGNKAPIDIYTRRDRTAYTPCEQPFVLRRVLSFDDMFYATPPWFEKKGLGLHLETEVEAIDRKKKVIIADGGEIPYDILLINTGAIARDPRIPGLEGDKVFTLTTELKHARALEIMIPTCKRVAILGAGAIGLEMAETLVNQGYEKVALIVSSPRIMSKQLDSDMAEKLEPTLLQGGVDLRLSTSVTKAEDLGKSLSLSLSDGTTLKVDFVLVAKGTTPNVDLARAAGLKIGTTGGIEVNPFLQTSDPSIYAAGDCMEGWNILTGEKSLTALATFSNRTGRTAGRNIHFNNTIPFMGALNTLGTEVFDSTIASVGFTEKAALKEGFQILTAVRKGMTRKTMYDGKPLWLKLIADKSSQALIGAQFIGPKEVSRIAERAIIIIGEKISLGKLSQYENIFSPPLGMAYDPVTMVSDILISQLIKEGVSVKWK
jgi:NADH oxidase (H2O2-forming)